MLAKGNKKVRCARYVLLMLCCLVVFSTDSFGQKKEYPEREIKLMVGTTPGGAADLWVRSWIDELSKILKVPVIAINEGGASGMAALIEARRLVIA